MAIPELTTEPDSAVTPAPSSRRSSRLDVRTIAESALLLDVTVLLVLIRTFLSVPGFQGLVRLACPIPFILLTLRRGPRAGLLATVAAFILLTTFVGPVFSNQVLVFGGLGTLFAWASQHNVRQWLTVLVGAFLYGVLYVLAPFLFGLSVLRIDLGKTLNDVHKQANSFLDSLGHFQLLGIKISQPLVSSLSSFAPGRWLLDLLHSIGLGLLTHPLMALIAFWAVFSVINVWAYLVISIELFRRLPAEARRDARGVRIDFFPQR